MDVAPVLLIGALTLGLAAQFVLPPASSAPPVAYASRGPVRLHETPAPAAVADYPAVLAHPLFNPDRSAVGSTSGPQSAPAGAFALVGVGSTAGSASAILHDAAGALRTLRLGETVDGWRLTVVGRDDAILTRGDKTQSLKVGAPATATPAAPSALAPR